MENKIAEIGKFWGWVERAGNSQKFGIELISFEVQVVLKGKVWTEVSFGIGSIPWLKPGLHGHS